MQDPLFPSTRFFPLQLALLMRYDALGVLRRLAQRYGDIARVTVGRRQIFLLSHPDLARAVLVTNHRSFAKGEALQRARTVLGNGLLTNEGASHLRQRRLCQPAFHRERIAAYANVMSAYAEQATLRWRPGRIDIAQELARLTLAIAGKTLFDADVEADARVVGAALNDLMALFGLLMLPFGQELERLPIPPARRLRQARAHLDAVISRLITERRTDGPRDDLLSQLVFAEDVDGDGTRMDDRQVRDEAMTLFLAGHETTANALCWTFYLLARHPEAEAHMHAEVDAALGGHLPTADDLARLPYTRAVFAEALRLYPPAWVFGRRATTAVTIGDYRIPADATVLISPWVMHRDPRFFTDPEYFLPERWLTDEMVLRPPPAYLPFGAGPRMCIGERFAWMEGVLILATVARHWHLRLNVGQSVSPRPAVTLRPRNGLPMVLTPRQSAPTNRGTVVPSFGGCPL